MRSAATSFGRTILLVVTVLILAGTGPGMPHPIQGARSPAGEDGLHPMVGGTSGPSTPPIVLGATPSPGAVCADMVPCPNGTVSTRLTVSATFPNASLPAPSVQVAFLLEASPAAGGAGPYDTIWNISNTLQFFFTHGQAIADRIGSAHPGVNLSFALADIQSTNNSWDDNDSTVVHVDLGRFVPAADFGADANSSFAAAYSGGATPGIWEQDHLIPGSYREDTFFVMPTITALYGALAGGLFAWSPNAKHVLVWVGASIPEDPAYAVSGSDSLAGGCSSACRTPSCDANYSFPTGPVPYCEGWTVSHNGIPNDTIGSLSRFAPPCRTAEFANCPVDILVVPGPATGVPADWWNYSDSQVANRTLLARNVESAGCDLAVATGGSWDGPLGTRCDGSSGTLAFAPLSAPNHFELDNDSSLLSAMGNISFGVAPPYRIEGTDHPLLSIVLARGFTPTPAALGGPGYAAHCTSVAEPAPTCASSPSSERVGGSVILGWNWSTNLSADGPSEGDAWSVSFNVSSAGLSPNGSVPLFVPGGLDGRPNVTGLHYRWGAIEVDEALPDPTLSVLRPFPVRAAITPSNVRGYDPDRVQFLATASGGAGGYGFVWTASGHPIGSGPILNRSFPAGDYTIGLTVTDALNETAVTEVAVTVRSGLLLESWLSPLNGSVPFSSVGGAEVVEGGYAPYRFVWSVDGGVVGAEANISLEFGRAGSHVVEVRAMDELTAIVSRTFNVSASAVPPLVAYLGATWLGPNRSCGEPAGATVSFLAWGAGGVPPYQDSWDFGDGTGVRNGSSIVHQFGRAGSFLTQLTVVDGVGQRAVATSNITVLPPSCLPPRALSTPPTGPPLALSLLGAGAVAAVIIGVVLARRYRAARA